MEREGNPNFRSFRVNQKVLKEVNRPGDRSSYKLRPKYDGPYLIRKVQVNGLSYEISKKGNEDVILKCHHRKLRPFHELSASIKKFLPNDDSHVIEEHKTKRYLPMFVLPNSGNRGGNFTEIDSSDNSSDEFEGFTEGNLPILNDFS